MNVTTQIIGWGSISFFSISTRVFDLRFNLALNHLKSIGGGRFIFVASLFNHSAPVVKSKIIFLLQNVKTLRVDNRLWLNILLDSITQIQFNLNLSIIFRKIIFIGMNQSQCFD